ncbi:multidrug resistance-associated protein 5 [Artemisia annua]|uniref:Multidrug resistance-associated protein 5 n=1 Tax=Artemisia annua TaxID=35608 RepID=A0A2U1MRE8_ARTAN|nr:multidrug resistance-associated protein 5 [Artemisia annua]
MARYYFKDKSNKKKDISKNTDIGIIQYRVAEIELIQDFSPTEGIKERSELFLMRTVEDYDIDSGRICSVMDYGSSRSIKRRSQNMANAGALFTTEEAGTICEGHYIVINNRACEATKVNTTPKRRNHEATVSFIAHDIFNRNRHEVPPVACSANCNVPVVKRRDYRLTRMPNGRFVRNRLAQEDQGNQLAQQGKRLVATVMSAMGEEQICAIPEDLNETESGLEVVLFEIEQCFNSFVVSKMPNGILIFVRNRLAQEDQGNQLAQQGKHLVATVMSAMGEEQICGFKDIKPIVWGSDLHKPLLVEEDAVCLKVTQYSDAGLSSLATLSRLKGLLSIGERLKSENQASLGWALARLYWKEEAKNAVFAGLYTLVSYAAKLVETVTTRQWYLGANIFGMHVRSALTAMVYRKGLRISRSVRQSHTSGEVVNYMVVDIQRAGDYACVHCHYFIYSYHDPVSKKEEELQEDATIVLSLGMSNTGIEVKDGVCSPRPTLSIIEMKVKRGMLVADCGSLGYRKLSFLSCILGEIPKVSDSLVRICGSAAYVSQSAWIQSGNIEENLFSHGDQTIIGNRGMNLSGGQKQRVQLARTLYQDADIYLLDDPFSAVDAHTGSELFKVLIEGQIIQADNENHGSAKICDSIGSCMDITTQVPNDKAYISDHKAFKEKKKAYKGLLIPLIIKEVNVLFSVFENGEIRW